MTAWYVDTSAALKLLVTEDETSALTTEIDHQRPDFIASYLLTTELHRAVQRYATIERGDAAAVLDGISLYEHPPSLLREAGFLPGPHLRSPDAIHLATAIRLGIEDILTYDNRMRAAARNLGMRVHAPGADA